MIMILKSGICPDSCICDTCYGTTHPCFDCRSEKSVLSRNPFGNQYLVWAVISSLALMLVVIYYPPLQPIFHTLAYTANDWLLIIGLSSIPTFLLAGSFLLRKTK